MLRHTFNLLHFTTVISKSSYVAIFPIHLDPPTLQHQEIFKLLLGMQDNSSNLDVSELPLTQLKKTFTDLGDETSSSSPSKIAPKELSSHLNSQISCSISSDIGLAQQQQDLQHRHFPSESIKQQRNSNMELFAKKLKKNSHLAPFEDIILIPNTRYPISLAHSTNLAALAVLAVRGLPRIHVDFTALEHPDASMPIVYELTQRYSNCVLVHWLHDAYEMQRWKNFSTIKLHVPLMLLKTISLPVSELVKPMYSSTNYHVKGVCSAGQEDVSKENVQKLDSVVSSLSVPSLLLERHPKIPELLHSDRNCVTGHGYKGSSTCDDTNEKMSQHKRSATLDSNLKDIKAITKASIESDQLAPNQPDTNQRYAWWDSNGACDDDSIEVSKSYYNSGSFSWLGANSHSSPRIGFNNVDMTVMDTPYSTQNSNDFENNCGNFVAYHPLSATKNLDDIEVSDNSETDLVIRARDIVVSADGFVKVVDESFKVKNKNSAENTVSDRSEKRKENIKGSTEEKLTADDLGSISFIMSSASSASVLSIEKELAQVRQELREIYSVTTLYTTQDAFQRIGGSETVSVHSSQNLQSVSIVENAKPQCTRVYGHNSRISEHCKRKEQSHYPAVQLARRNVSELLEELYQPLSYHHHNTDTSVVHPNRICKPPHQFAHILKIDTKGCETSSSETTNPSVHQGRHSFAQKEHAEASKGPTICAIGYRGDPNTRYKHVNSSFVTESQKRPVVEVHSVVRTTGADVRQALWEQEIDPTYILSECVLRYIDSYGLYRDSRKSKTNLELKEHHSGLSSFVFSGTSPIAKSVQTSSGDGNSLSSSRRFSLSKFQSCLHSSYRNATKVFFESIIPRLEIHYDRNNPIAREKYEVLKVFQVLQGEEPDLIVPIGGDGYMMHCIRQNWRRFIPFYGVNAGNVGYLLNDCSVLEDLFSHPLMMNSTNMLYCQAERETESSDRVLLSEMAFNDAWVERSSGQAAFLRILVNGEERIKGLRADGVLVSTAAGSTAYSRAVGASPIPVGVPLIQMVGSNVVSPSHWQPVHLNQEDVVEFEVLDHVKRPCRCFVDSVDLGNVLRMQVRTSRVAGVTLVFSNSCDLQQKLFEMQFPKMD